MANRFSNPFPQFWSSSAAYSGGSLTFYASGTSTPLDTYSDSTLLVANTNPVVLNSAGRPAVAVFLSDASYKVVLKDTDGNTIWTADPVYASDFSTSAQFATYAGNPNGNVAGTAGSGSIKADAIWDTTNSILYICTTTGTAVTAIWTAVNASTAAAVVVAPQGRLTLTTATPTISGDVATATSVYYTPCIGNIIPIYNGSSFTQSTFAELTLSLVASHAANAIYDVFVFSNSGVVTIATGPAWSTATAGSGARGSGGGTTELARVNGLLVNAVQITGRNGSTTYTIAANQATYVGSISMDGTNGQVSCHRSIGLTRKWGVWNAYNRTPVTLRVQYATASWTYATNTWRPSNNDTDAKGTVFTGLAEEDFDMLFQQATTTAGGGSIAGIAIGWNTTSSPVGMPASIQSTALNNSASSHYVQTPALGKNDATTLEIGVSGTTTFSGGASGHMMTISYNA